MKCLKSENLVYISNKIQLNIYESILIFWFFHIYIF